MPSDRKQINVRVDEETEGLIRELLPVVSAAVGLSLSQSDLFRLGLVELRRKYAAGQNPPDPPVEKPARKPRGKK